MIISSLSSLTCLEQDFFVLQEDPFLQSFPLLHLPSFLQASPLAHLAPSLQDSPFLQADFPSQEDFLLQDLLLLHFDFFEHDFSPLSQCDFISPCLPSKDAEHSDFPLLHFPSLLHGATCPIKNTTNKVNSVVITDVVIVLIIFFIRLVIYIESKTKIKKLIYNFHFCLNKQTTFMAITYADLKGPKGLPIIGNLHKIEITNMHNQLEGWAKEFGSVYKLVLGPSKLAVITDVEIIQEILKERPHLFRRMEKMDKVMREEGVKGVFNAEGDEWKAHRRIVNKGLDVNHQQAFFPDVLLTLERLFNKWNGAANNAENLDIQQDLLRFTVDVTSALAFGSASNTIENDGDVIQDHLAKIFPIIFSRINAPIPLWRYYKTKKDKEFDIALVEVNKFIDGLILEGKKRLAALPELKANPSNFLESLLVAAENESILTDEDVKGNLLTVLMAGEDTTAHTLAWAIFLLAQNPDAQKELQKEAGNVIADNNWLTNYKEHTKLTYTEAVALETMRMKPVAPLLLFEPLKDVEIKGYAFKKGSRLLVESRYAAMQDENFSDAKTFNPKRWVKVEQGKCPMNHDTKAYIPFGAGARFCPGKNLAMLEMKLVLSMLAKNFSIELITPKEEVKEVMAFTMMPSSYQVKLVKR